MTIDPQLVLLSMWGVVGLCVAMLVYWSFRQNNTFSALDLICTDGRADQGKFAYMGAFLISTWGFWVLIEQGKMTEYFFLGYVTAFVGGGAYMGTRNKYRPPDEDDGNVRRR